jgi:tRNA(Ile)-lysidine synthase
LVLDATANEAMTVLPVTRDEADTLFAPLLRFPRVALAVSGGPDSLALLHLLAQWRAARSDGPELVVLTVDHGLRPQSRDEALLVAGTAEAAGLPNTTLVWEHGAVDEGLQARARAARYDLMAAYCHAHDIPALVTAHHLDDQAETFLMRLMRGSGLDGLAAIPEEGSWAGLTLLRPLLDVSKARLVATVEAAGVVYVTDPSNTDPRFERGRLRSAMETLTGLGLTAHAIALSAKRLRRARAALDLAADAFLGSHAELSAAGYAAVDTGALDDLPEEVALRVLSRLLATIGGGVEPVQLAKLEVLRDALKQGPDKAHTLGRCRIVPKARRLFFFREMRKEGLPELKLCPGERTLWDNRFAVELRAAEEVPITVRALGEEGIQTLTEQAALPASLPRAAARALPACWRGRRLLGLPDFGQGEPSLTPLSRHEGSLDCRARFLRGHFDKGYRSSTGVEEECTSWC